jgi:hypothetical protein
LYNLVQAQNGDSATFAELESVIIWVWPNVHSETFNGISVIIRGDTALFVNFMNRLNSLQARTRGTQPQNSTHNIDFLT